MTQAEADRIIDYRIRRAILCEQRRDACKPETAEYWKHHDAAQVWHARAERLMPASARTITLD